MKTIKGWKWKQKHFFLTYLNMVWLRYWIRPLCAFRRAVPLSNVVSSHLTLPYKSFSFWLVWSRFVKERKTRGELYTLFEIFFSKEGWRFFFFSDKRAAFQISSNICLTFDGWNDIFGDTKIVLSKSFRRDVESIFWIDCVIFGPLWIYLCSNFGQVKCLWDVSINSNLKC